MAYCSAGGEVLGSIPARPRGCLDFDWSALKANRNLPMQNLIKRFVRDDRGATAIEYGLIAAGISVAIIAVVQGLGTNLNTTFGSVQTALAPAA
jgi:pilus assembly protein Flp/PilA